MISLQVTQLIKRNFYGTVDYVNRQEANDMLMRRVAILWLLPSFVFSVVFLLCHLYISSLCIFLLCVNHVACIRLSEKGISLLPRILEATLPTFLIFILANFEFPYSVKMKLLLIILNISLLSFSFIFFSIKEWKYIAVAAALIFVYGYVYEHISPILSLKNSNVLLDSDYFENAIYILSFGMLAACFMTFKVVIENQNNAIRKLLIFTESQNSEILTQRNQIEEKAIALTQTLEELKSTQEEILCQRDAIEEKALHLSNTLDLLKQSQDKLVESEKMVALGQLIAGVAHEINTPLGAIRSSVGNITGTLEYILPNLAEFFSDLEDLDKKYFFDLIERSAKASLVITSKEERVFKRSLVGVLEDANVPKADEYADTLVDMGIYDNIEYFIPFFDRQHCARILQMAYKISGLLRSAKTITTATERASKVVFALKNFAHYDHSGEMTQAHLSELIDTVLTLYHNQLKHGITIIKNFEPLPAIFCYPDELNQVWTNILHNALQAMDYKGTLQIDISQDDEYAYLSITDSGSGIPPEIQGKIFNAFFTTKPQGEGSGLGLDIVLRIVEKHLGKISFTSNPGKTTFTVQLPKKINI